MQIYSVVPGSERFLRHWKPNWMHFPDTCRVILKPQADLTEVITDFRTRAGPSRLRWPVAELLVITAIDTKQLKAMSHVHIDIDPARPEGYRLNLG